MSLLYQLIRGAVKSVQSKNKADDNVKTADASVFSDLTDRLEKTTSNVPESKSDEELYEEIRRQIEESRHQNECDENVETADSSVYSNLSSQIEELKAKLAAEKAKNSSEYHHEAKPAFDPMKQTTAMTSSPMGSLQMRANPEFGAAINIHTIPDKSQIRILQWSDKTINLDGKDSKFVLVEYNGQQGWILDSYLDFA